MLDGVTESADDLNILDGVTSAGLVVPDGQLTLGSTAVTSTAAELNILDGVTATTAELNYVDGVTSNVQTQLDAKAAIAGPTFTGTPAAPTASAGTNTTQIATTAFVTTAVSNVLDSALEHLILSTNWQLLLVMMLTLALQLLT